jgi:peptidyl-prolyl cis-trans isomerase D
MLEAFRNAAKSWVAKGLLGLLILSFAAWGITDVFSGFRVQELATVGNQSVDGAAYTRVMQQTLQQLTQQQGRNVTFEEAKKLGLDRDVRDNLIAGAAIDNKASNLGVEISAGQVGSEIQSNPAFRNSQGIFDEAIFRRVLENNGTSVEGYLAAQMRDQSRRAVLSPAEGGIAPSVLAEALHRFVNEKRDARYFVIRLTDSELPKPTAEEVKKHYEANPNAYTAPEFRSVAILKVDPSDIMDRFQVSEQELQNGYDRLKAEYETPERRTIQQLSFPSLDEAKKAHDRIKVGEDFLKIAQELRLKENDFTFTEKTKPELLDPKISEAAFSLAENVVSEPIAGQLATVLVRTTKITPGKKPALGEIKPDLQKRLQMEKATEDIQNIYDTVEDMRAEQRTFEEISKQVSIPLTVVPAVSANGLDTSDNPVALPGAAEVLGDIFGSEVGAETDAKTVDQGFVWFEVREIMASKLRPLEGVKARVEQDWQAANMRKLIGDKARKLVNEAKTGKSFEDLAREAGGAEIKTVSGVMRNQTSEAFDGLATTALYSVPEKAKTWALESDGKSARIIEVSKIGVPKYDPASAQIKQMGDEAKLGMSRDIGTSLVTAVKTATEISINETLWQQISGPAQSQ